MKRRDALKLVATLMGSAVSSSVVSAVLSGSASAAGAGYTLQTMSAVQDELVATIAELILPQTDTPGARAAGVNVFIDRVLTSGFTAPERDRFLAGLQDLERRADQAFGLPFVNVGSSDQIRLLTELQAEAAEARRKGASERPFFHMMKELTLVGYYTSEVGATQELRYVHAAGRYDGDIPFSEVGRAYA